MASDKWLALVNESGMAGKGDMKGCMGKAIVFAFKEVKIV